MADHADISMQYSQLMYDRDYKQLPMGMSQSPDVAQEVMEHVLDAIKDIEIYIDNITPFSDMWDEHLELLDKVLSKLQEAGSKKLVLPSTRSSASGASRRWISSDIG